MDFDEIVEASHEASCDTWFDLYNLLQGAPLAKFISTFRDDKPCWQQSIDCGSFNFCCRFAFEDGVQWMIRFPMPGKVMHPVEKIKREVATMKFIHAKTQIRIPKLIAYGLKDELGLGPFIITEFIRGKTLDKLWKENPKEPRSRLREDIDEKDEEVVYRQVANILLELAAHKFDRIGSLSFDDGDYSVLARPLSLKMNEVARVGGVNDDDHLLAPFDTTRDYFDHIVQQNLNHLLKQRNSVDDEQDARRKYLNRRLFHTITSSFVSNEYNSGPFTLLCDDFRPSNFLVSDDLTLWWIDLEWTYTAPYQMLYSPPRWLLLWNPCRWADSPGLKDLYKVKFEKFHQILVEEESKKMLQAKIDSEYSQKGTPESDTEHLHMSSLMRRAMEDGKFWYHELIRESFDFDSEFLWEQIAEISNWRNSDVEIPEEDMESFLALKMAELRDYEVEVKKGNSMAEEKS